MQNIPMENLIVLLYHYISDSRLKCIVVSQNLGYILVSKIIFISIATMVFDEIFSFDQITSGQAMAINQCMFNCSTNA